MLRRSCACLCFLLPTLSFAQSADPAQLFEQGRRAFERQDFVGALDAFEAAIAARMAGPTVHFNLGVAAYRAGRYDRARLAFEEVSRTPGMTALAHYNLGLVALAANQEQRAIEFFTRVYADSNDERLTGLARAQLERIGSGIPAPAVAWAGYASTGAGYDDNVTLTAGGQALGIARESDLYADTQLVGSVSFAEHWRVDADASYLNYADVDAYDQWGLGTGARYRLSPGAWTVDVGAQVGVTYLDGERFDVRETVYVQGARNLSPARAARLRYRLSNVDGSDQYPGLEGLRHELSARMTQRIASWTAGLAYGFELSDYDAAALSAFRHQLSADLRAPLTSVWSARASLGYRHSDYDADDIGTEDRLELGAGAELMLTDRWTLAIQYLFTDNQADTRDYEYQRNRLFVGVDATF